MKSYISKLEYLLRGKKNLLAFSYGVDSTALYHLLKEANINFDIALVNYKLREQANKEEKEAYKLAKSDNKKIYISYAPKWKSNFEANARRFRYNFFESLIEKYEYENLLTAHQLNDRLEWFMMRLIRGAGVLELSGMRNISQRRTSKGKIYNLIRPLLDTPRSEIEKYLKTKEIYHFFDESNKELKYERNNLRPILNPLINDYSSNITKTFKYLEEESEIILTNSSLKYNREKLRIYYINNQKTISIVASQALKELGYLLSRAQREILNSKKSIVAGRKWVVEFKNDRLFIAPYIQKAPPMPKEFKEQCRIYKIPVKIRPYIYKEGIEVKDLKI